jgi:hypothetical protein
LSQFALGDLRVVFKFAQNLEVDFRVGNGQSLR